MKFVAKYLTRFAFIMTMIVFVLYNFGVHQVYRLKNNDSNEVFFAEAKTYLNHSGVFIAIKTTNSNHRKRLKIILDTWISTCKNQTYIFTDTDDLNLTEVMPDGHVINTKCAKSHNILDLACKLGKEIETFLNSDKKWFCHVDDDNYLNIDKLVETLGKYNYKKRWYLGKPSLNYPWNLKYNNAQVKFWFGTGGAGFCLSGGLRKDLMQYARSEKMTKTARDTGEADDVVIAFIVYYFMGVNMTKIDSFHSHMEHMPNVTDPLNQITLSYRGDNVANVNGFDVKEDPSRFKSVHCHLHPGAEICKNFQVS